ncbi:MAG TPA: anthranilate synthase family protein [Micromonosporaceae bacterium]|nr:anthranilate synthase family protein [Micromonosporaceae bacterium]
MTIGAVSEVGTTDARRLLRSLLAPDPPPFALLRRAGAEGGAVELMTGQVTRATLLADLPVPTPGNGAQARSEVLAVVPFRQVTERGYACHDDGEPILALVVDERAALPAADAVDLLPDVAVAVCGYGFDPGDDEYEKVVEQIIDGEIRTGEGSNFVIKRSFLATLAQYRPEVAMSIFRRLLLSESNAYWTFLVHAGDRTFVGASPEQHVQVVDGKARMNPISGTYRYPPSGARMDDILTFLADQKEIDELYMVVDEELKMLAGVCDAGARVRGPYLREMARLAHTEYVLEGASVMDVRDVLRETMFAPTVIGSPLQNACRVIVRHEPGGRGYYGGAVALFGRDPAGRSTMDSAIMIRTAEVRRDGTLRIDVGATLVRDSRPAEEVAETWAKVDALLAAIGVDRATTGARVDSGQTGSGQTGSGQGGSGQTGSGQTGSGQGGSGQTGSGQGNSGQGNGRRGDSGRGNSGPAAAGAGPFGTSIAANPKVLAALARRNAGLSSFWLSAPVPGRPSPPVGRALIVDAEDRFVGMLGHQIRALGHEVTIRPLARVVPADVDAFDLVVLGPGPGDPRSAADPRIARLRGLVERVLAQRVPFIAECLSHQVLSALLGLRLVKRDRPNQGTQRRIDLFGASELVGFYNSYSARHGTDRVPAAAVRGAVELCRDPDTGEVHALRGRHFASVQFHLESVLTQHGAEILAGLVTWATQRAGDPALLDGEEPDGP